VSKESAAPITRSKDYKTGGSRKGPRRWNDKIGERSRGGGARAEVRKAIAQGIGVANKRVAISNRYGNSSTRDVYGYGVAGGRASPKCDFSIKRCGPSGMALDRE
jgi:hypothetical protein